MPIKLFETQFFTQFLAIFNSILSSLFAHFKLNKFRVLSESILCSNQVKTEIFRYRELRKQIFSSKGMIEYSCFPKASFLSPWQASLSRQQFYLLFFALQGYRYVSNFMSNVRGSEVICCHLQELLGELHFSNWDTFGKKALYAKS